MPDPLCAFVGQGAALYLEPQVALVRVSFTTHTHTHT